MKRLVALVMGLLGTAFGWPLVHAQLPPPLRRLPDDVREMEVRRDIAYVPEGHPRQRLDLYLPKNARRPLPLIVWIHGGAWMGGSKDSVRIARPYLDRGYAVASIGYRLSSDAPFPAQIEDCKAAVRWLRAHADEYGLDPNRFAAWGSSAGGHLAALLGTAGDVAGWDVGLHTNVSSRVQAVCDFFGPADLRRIPQYLASGMSGAFGRADSPESRLLGGPVTANLVRAATASPAAYASPDDPPFFIAHGDQDPIVPHDQSMALFEALKHAGVHVHFHTVLGGGHGHGFGGPEFDRMIQTFFDRWLKGDASAPAPTGAVQTAAPAVPVRRPPRSSSEGDHPPERFEELRAHSEATPDGRVRGARVP